MARSRRQEQSLPDEQVFVGDCERKPHTDSTSGLVRFIEDAQVKRFVFTHRRRNNVGRLISAEDES